MQLISYPPKFWPTGGSLDNYLYVFTMQNGVYMRWILNSIIVSGSKYSISVTGGIYGGLCICKKEIPRL